MAIVRAARECLLPVIKQKPRTENGANIRMCEGERAICLAFFGNLAIQLSSAAVERPDLEKKCREVGII